MVKKKKGINTRAIHTESGVNVSSNDAMPPLHLTTTFSQLECECEFKCNKIVCKRKLQKKITTKICSDLIYDLRTLPLLRFPQTVYESCTKI